MPRKRMTDEQKAERDRKKEVKQLKSCMEQDKKECHELEIPVPPAYFHEVGDRVVYGAWQWTGILKKYDGGRYYKCFTISWKTNTNQHNHHDYKIHYEPWFNLGFLKETLNTERFEEDEDVRISYQQRDLSSLLSMMVNRWGIDLEPEYQRGNAWNQERKDKLIDSIFKNIDIGKFTIIRRPWGSNSNVPLTPKLYEMLDGKQRLMALFEFYMGRFTYKGKYYYELHTRDQGHFRHYNISWGESSPLTKEQKYRYFLRLNETGEPVSKKHLDKVKKMWEDEIINNDMKEVEGIINEDNK